MFLLNILCAAFLLPPGNPQDTVRTLGKKVFFTTCSTCHRDSVGILAPGRTVLSTMTPRAILAALNTGKMQQQAASLSELERKAVAVWLTNSDLKTSVIPSGDYVPFSFNATVPSTYDYSGWGGNLLLMQQSLQHMIIRVGVETLQAPGFAAESSPVSQSAISVH
jgi:hypothetical protein